MACRGGRHCDDRAVESQPEMPSLNWFHMSSRLLRSSTGWKNRMLLKNASPDAVAGISDAFNSSGVRPASTASGDDACSRLRLPELPVAATKRACHFTELV